MTQDDYDVIIIGGGATGGGPRSTWRCAGCGWRWSSAPI